MTMKIYYKFIDTKITSNRMQIVHYDIDIMQKIDNDDDDDGCLVAVCISVVNMNECQQVSIYV